MWSIIHKAGSPRTCYRWAKAWQPWIMAACLLALVYGLFAGLLLAPADYQQGDAYRIIFLHVPCAICSLAIYMVMSIAVIFYFIWKLKVADIVAKISAPLGALFTFLTLVSGSLWGKPTWGTFWIWDARLTSELILLFIYFGVMSVRAAIPDLNLAARASGIVAMIGMVNIPIVHYSVNWWQTLHQGATILKFGAPNIANSMLHPLLAMIAGFFLYYIWMLLLRLRYELLQLDHGASWVQAVLERQ
ncbi:MAG: heme ABC transporter permease [Gammaproteobacteria bacterium]|nr:heme ABC transporter permease [Gammaproteobacteria bacterium]